MKDLLLKKMELWLAGIGLPLVRQEVADDSFLPGVCLSEGKLLVDGAKLQWPGDVLHEAGHLATAPPSRRGKVNGNLASSPAEEMAALAWSYAAAVDAGIDPLVVFHEGGYKQGGAQLAAQYASVQPPGGPGVPMLQWWGMTSAFPRMTQWVRESEDPV